MLNSVDIIISVYTTVVTIPTATCDNENISLENSSVCEPYESHNTVYVPTLLLSVLIEAHCVLCEVQIECNADSLSFGRSKPRVNSSILLTPRYQTCRNSGNCALLGVSTS